MNISTDEVTASWGMHCSLCYGNSHSSWGDTWVFNPLGFNYPGVNAYVYFNARGRVIGWDQP